MRLRGAAVVGERAEAGVCDADLIVVRAVGEAARAARADEVVGACGVYRAGVVMSSAESVAPFSLKLPATMVERSSGVPVAM